ncbi:MAG: copper transporter [Coriobacteriia bacterium]|nr:copper transporter [Coriobacteriia bacterium]
MYNLRYHLASLISVFFALALGLLLGGLIAGEAPTNVQEALLQGIEREIAQTRESNAQLRAENIIAYDFSDLLLANFVDGRLTDYTVLVIGSADRDVQSAIVALENAGATTAHIVPLYDEDSDSWLFSSDVAFETLNYQAIVNVYRPLDEQGNYRDNYFDYLQELGQASDALVVMASIDDSENTLVTEGWNAGFSGTNQLGNRYGAYTLVVLVSSNTTGKFGSLDGATLYPSVPDHLLPAHPAEDEVTPEEDND